MHQLDLQASVLRAAAHNLGGSGASLFTCLAVGGTMGQLGAPLPPPLPSTPLYHAAINGQQLGTFTLPQLRELALAGQLTRQHYRMARGYGCLGVRRHQCRSGPGVRGGAAPVAHLGKCSLAPCYKLASERL